MAGRIEAIQSIVVWALALIAAVLLLAAVIWAVRRWVVKSAPPGKDEGAFSLQQLREMRDAAQISEREYQALKAEIIASVRRKDGAADSAADETDGRGITDDAKRNHIKGRVDGRR